MKIAIIQGSARSNGNTRKSINFLLEHISADVFDLLDYEIKAYDYLHRNKGDDFLPLIKNIIDNYDVIVFATPVYWYTMSGILKNFLDRISDLLQTEKDWGRKLRGKHLAALSCSEEHQSIEGFFIPFQLTAGYLGMNYIGNVHAAIDLNEPSENSKKHIKDFCNKISALLP